MSDDTQHNVQTLTIADYIDALDVLCCQTKHTLFIFEKDFINIGFNSSTRFEILRNLLLSNPNNKLQLLAHDTKQISQYCPRLMTLLRQFGHNMFIYQTPKNLQHITEPFAIADESIYVRRFHFDNSGGIYAQNDNGKALLFKSRFNEMWQVSRPSPWTSTFNI